MKVFIYFLKHFLRGRKKVKTKPKRTSIQATSDTTKYTQQSVYKERLYSNWVTQWITPRQQICVVNAVRTKKQKHSKQAKFHANFSTLFKLVKIVLEF